MQQNNHTIRPWHKSAARIGTFVLTLCAGLILGCSNGNTPKGVLNQDQMVDVMTDLHLVDGYVSTIIYNDTIKVNKQDLYKSVYRKHKITDSVYELSLKHYSMDPQLLDTLYVQVEKRLSLKEDKLNGVKPEVKKLLEVE